MNQSPALSLALGVFLASVAAHGASEVVISEIMYHPFHTLAQAEDTGKEWIELYNRGTNTVNLNGWRLTRGIEFTFTTGSIPPGGFLVVAADRTNFLASYPAVTNVVGNWTGRLANSDNAIRLLNPMGEEVNEVEYADSGEWAVRARLSPDAYGLRGWDWLAPHDGGGRTLELINLSMPNAYGQNWSSSLGSNGTPGRVNSVFATNTAPFIQEVSFFPIVPKSVDSVTIKAFIEDETPGTVTATLYYRNATSAFPPAFSTTTMYDDGAHGDGRAGDGIYAASVSAQVNGTVIEFFVAADDGEGRSRTWPAPSRNSPDLGGGILAPEDGANAEYQVDDSVYTGVQPIYRIVMRESERAFLASIAGNLRNSDAQANGTLISIDPNDTEVHHRVSFRRRGAGSRGAAIPNYRVTFASDRRWKGVTAVNLNSQYTHAQVGGSAIAAASGLNIEYQKPVQVRVNGVNLVSAGSPQFGSYAQQEAPNGDFATRHYPDDPNGNVYRASDGSHRVNLSYQGTDPNSYSSIGYSKTSNTAEYDWSDLINLTDVLNNTPDATYGAAVRQRVNVEQWMRYFAVFTLLDSRETSLATGNGDDYGMYRGIIDPRFQLLGHDFDTILGQGDTGGNVNDSIFRMNTLVAIARFMRHPEFAPIYYRTLTNLIYTSFSPEKLGANLDQQLGSWVPAGIIGNMKNFAVGRNAGVLAQIPLNLTVSHSLPLSGGYPSTINPTVTVFGSANAVSTRTVLVNGAASTWSAWNARWTNTVTLLPGINRLVVQTLDENGVEFERGQLDVWYNDGTVTDVTGEISGVVNWTAAEGPYLVTGAFAVPDEAVLNIEAGTTIYVAPGGSITVRDTGYINATGTEQQHVRIGRQPNVSGNWAGIVISGSLAANRLSYVDFDSCSGSTVNGRTAQVHVNQSSVRFDHCTWPSTPVVQYISFDSSSFIVEGCTFASYPAPNGAEMVHGVNGIPGGGYGIFRDNYFGRTWGYNDVIDFTGGQRPAPILQIIGNVFEGASDDHLDLDSADAWIEGNYFLHAHRDPSRTDDARDTASAISGGVDFAGQYPEWTIINNVFYDVDHAVLNKGGGRYTFVNNTVAHVNKEWGAGLNADIAAFNWTDVGVVLPDPALGSGAYIANNVIWDTPLLVANYNAANHTMVFENNILPTAWSGPGSNNVVADPRLNLALITSKTNADWRTVRAALMPLAGSPAVEAGFGGKYNLGGLNAKGLLVYGEPRGTTTVNTATINVAPGGTFNWGTNVYPWGYTAYKWRLDNGAWSSELSTTIQPAVTLSNLSNGPHTVYVSGRNDAGYYQDNPLVYPTNGSFPSMVTTSRTWTVDTTLARIVINEVLARNVAAINVGGKFPDAIELYNAGKAAVDLGGMSLSDEPDSRKFTFAAGTMIPAGGYLVVYAGTGEAPGRIYTGFGLNDSGEGVYLRESLAEGGSVLDSIVFGLQVADLSIGRLANGTWGLTHPTFGSANVAQRTGRQDLLKINEWLAAAGSVFSSDFIEIFNPDSLPVSLGGLALSDAPMGAPRMSVIAPLSFIAANGWQSFVADGNPVAGNDHVGFRLTAEGGWISLANLDGSFIDIVVYATQAPDISMGRSPDGTAVFISFNQATPGGGNPGQTVIVTPISTTIMPFNKTWRMEASGIDLGTAWRSPTYDDSSWFSGAALFWADDSGTGGNPPLTVNSFIPFTSPKQVTVYFRTTFNYTGPTNAVTFLLSQAIDDGCVVYLNDVEVYRYNFAPGVTVTYGSRPSLVSGSAQILSGIPVMLPSLVQGTNYLAIELHQQSATSSDLAMALQLESQRYITNYLGIPIVLNEVFVSNQSQTNSSGKVVDWVELYNPSTNTIDISDLSLSDDPGQPRRWTFPQGASIAPGGYYVVEFDDSEAYTPFNAGFELSSESGAVYLFHRPTAGGALIDSVVYGIQVADLALGRAVSGPNNSWTLCAPTRAAANAPLTLGDATLLKVNEWMPNAASGDDDWFELYNPGPYPVALGGLRLTDDLSNRTKHTVRALSFIGAGPEAWVKFIADNDTAKGADHVGFALNNTSESIGLYTTNAVPGLIDSITYNGSQNGVSQGRLPDGAPTLSSFTNSVSPGAANWLPFDGVVINEILTRPSANQEQAIEIYNPTDVDVAIGGWFLSNARRDLKRYEIPAGTIVPAGGFAVFYEYQFNPSNGVPPSLAFNSSDSDEVYLSAADANGNLTGYRVTEDFGASAAGASFGRHQKSTGSDFVAMPGHTFGASAAGTLAEFRIGTGATNNYPIVGPLVINEIQYHPPDIGTNDNPGDEFIELLNISPVAVTLHSPAYPTNTWRLRNAVDFDFPSGISVEPGGFVVVVSFDPATNAVAAADFRTRYGIGSSVVLLGPWSGKLDNSSEAVELQRPDDPLLSPDPDAGRVPYIQVDRVNYSDSSPWASAADGRITGAGASLQRRLSSRYGNDATNWVAAAPTPGSPNGLPPSSPPMITSSPTNTTVGAGTTVIFAVSASGTGPLIYQWRFNDAPIPSATNSSLPLLNVQAGRAGRYSVTVANAWGSALAGPAKLVVQAPPMIVQQPQSRAVVEGEDTTFVVTASGGLLSYQWRFFGINLPGATSASLSVSNINGSYAGPYSVVVSNSFGAVTSLVANLSVLMPPVVAMQPQSVDAIIGTSVGFIVAANGTTPLSYQWQFNGAPVPGATAPSFTIQSAQPTNEGSYAVVVTNIAGVATSMLATLTVIVPPTVSVIATDSSAAEPGGNTGLFTFLRSGATTSNLLVHYTISGSASASGDYSALSGTVQINAGDPSATVGVTPLNDAELEGDETVVVTLASQSAYLIGSPSAATVVIRDDDNQPPVVAIITPSSGQLYVNTPTNLAITATATDPDSTVASVEFFANGTNKIGEDLTAPYSIVWTNAPAGSYALTARATDNLGSTAVSPAVDVILNAMPTVGIASPVPGTSFTTPATIPISAFAADNDGTVTQVTFHANALLIGRDTSAPYSITLSNATPGAYGLRAVATDNRGAVSTSAVVTVVVNQPGIFDDFEPGVDLAQWSAFGSTLGTSIRATNYGGSVSGVNSLWFGGDFDRWAATRAIDASLGGAISFQLRFADGGGEPWETLDVPGEGVVLEFSVDGGSNWLNITTFDTPGANYTVGWARQQFTLPAGAQTTNTMFRWRQISHSGSCCDHWAIDDVQVLVGPTPPTISTHPGDQYTIIGGAASFTVSVFGSSPFGYQWQFNGTDLPGATNAVLGLSNITTNQAGLYSVVVTNAYGTAVSSNAALVVREAGSDYFRVAAFRTTGAALVEHANATGDDHGGIAVSSSQVLVTGDGSTARFSAANLSAGASLGTLYDGLVSDLRTETVYTLATNATSPLRADNTVLLTHLLELNGGTGLPNGNVVRLSRPIPLENYYGNYGFFSGYGRAVIHNGERVYDIALPSGVVTDLGQMATSQHNSSESWGYWGVAELTTNGLYLVYVRDSQTIVRRHVPDGLVSVAATFSSLSDMASFSVSVPRNRWYFHHEGSSQFGGGDESVGYADAQFDLNPGTNQRPIIVIAPQNVQALEGGAAYFSVSAVGSPTMAYQWRFNGSDIPSALGPTFGVLDVRPENIGSYSVVITNSFGSVTSALVTLSIGLPPVITNQPSSQTVLAGAEVVFTVGHSGTGPFMYQWRINGSDFIETTTNSLRLPSVSYYYNGDYTVEVRNAVGSDLSATATLIVLSPPFFTEPFTDKQVLRGMNTSLSASLDGTPPYYVRWKKDGADLATTNAMLLLSNVQPANAGLYTLTATNVYGSIVRTARLEVLEPDGDSFAVQSLTTNNAIVTDAFPLVSYVYQNGLAADAQSVFLNGYGPSGNGGAAAFSATDLSGGTSVGGARNGLVTDLKSRIVYSLADGANLIGYGGTVNSLVRLDGNGQPTAGIITLSTNIYIGSGSAIFAGYGRIVLLEGNNTVWDVALPSGRVTRLGTVPYFQYEYAYGFAYRGWGVAERIGTNTWLVHVRDNGTIERVRVPDGMTEVVANFDNLGSYAGNFTVSLLRNRWYYNNAYGSQFGGNSQNNLVSLDASFIYRPPTTAPIIVDQPASRYAPVGSTAAFSVVAEGAPVLRYQWRFGGMNLAGATNDVLSIANVRGTNAGDYSVIVSNHLGSVTSAVATLTIDYGASSSNAVPLLTMTNTTWRYNQTGVFTGTTWAGSNFNHSTWSSGRGVLAVENNAAITPLIGTTLILGRTTYYFRVYFNNTSNYPPGTVLRATTLIDDGAVILVNGRIVQRVRMTGGSYTANTFANGQPSGGDAVQESFFWSATNLVRGSNVIAAEVHQASATSSDIVWGMALDALVPLANRPPVITNHPVSISVPPGTNVSFTVGATGTSPLSYQWRHEGTNIPGATSPTLNLTNVQPQDGGVYVAVVTNRYDSAISSNAVLVLLVPPLRFTDGTAAFSAPGQFTLQFTSDPGAVLTVQRSTNLIDWADAGTVTNSTGAVQFTDPTAGGAPYRFYRLKLIP